MFFLLLQGDNKLKEEAPDGVTRGRVEMPPGLALSAEFIADGRHPPLHINVDGQP